MRSSCLNKAVFVEIFLPESLRSSKPHFFKPIFFNTVVVLCCVLHPVRRLSYGYLEDTKYD
jgi:hypothetical protein